MGKKKKGEYIKKSKAVFLYGPGTKGATFATTVTIHVKLPK